MNLTLERYFMTIIILMAENGLIKILYMNQQIKFDFGIHNTFSPSTPAQFLLSYGHNPKK